MTDLDIYGIRAELNIYMRDEAGNEVPRHYLRIDPQCIRIEQTMSGVTATVDHHYACSCGPQGLSRLTRPVPPTDEERSNG